MAATVTTVTTEEIKIEPKLRRKMQQLLQEYARLKTQADALKAEMATKVEKLGTLRDEIGVTSVGIDGFKVTLVAPVRSKFNKKKFVSLGGDLKIYEQAVDNVPSRTFTKVTVPGDKEESDE